MDEDAVIKKFKKEINSGAAALVVLGLMVRSEESLYGYQIAKLLEGAAGGELPMKPGALYPVLRSMQAQGLLTSHVEPSVSAPPRRYYSATDEGRSMLETWTEIWQSTGDFVKSVLEGRNLETSQQLETDDD